MYAVKTKDGSVRLLNHIPEGALDVFEFTPDELPTPPSSDADYRLVVDFDTKTFGLEEIRSEDPAPEPDEVTTDEMAEAIAEGVNDV